MNLYDQPLTVRSKANFERMSAAAAAWPGHAKALAWRLALLIVCLTIGWRLSAHLEWRVLWNARFLLLTGLENTWLLAISAITIGMAAGILLAATRMYAVWGIRHAGVAIIETVRATPDLMVIFWVYYSLPGLTGVTMDAWTAAVGSLSTIAAAYLAEDVRAGVGSVPRLQWESGYATGLSPSRIFLHIILPQAIRNMVPAIITTFVKLFKITSIVFVVGVIEFFRAAIIVNNREVIPYETYLLLAIVYFVCCYGISATVRRVLR